MQPLRIPSGWTVQYNSGLHEIDPDPAIVPESEVQWYFKQDLLQMTHTRRDRLLDVGWYPDGDLANGAFGLVVSAGDFRGRLLHEFETRDRHELVAEIERLLVAVANGTL